MMHHPSIHHQQMAGPHAPQHITTQGIPTHQQYQTQIPRENRIPMGHNHQGGAMGMNGIHRMPPHSMPPMQHHHAPHQHHIPQMRSIRRSYNGSYGGAAPHYGPRGPPAAMHTSQVPHTPVVSAQRTAASPQAPQTAQSGTQPTESATNRENSSPKSESPTSNGQNNPMANNKEKTSMCLVNELARFNKIKHQYRLTSETGPAHKKVFTVTLRLGDDEEYTAEGSSIKRAQHAAAAAALVASKLPAPPPRTPHLPSHHRNHGGTVMPTVELNALAMKRCSPAVYSAEPPVPTHYAPYSQRVVHRVRVMVCGRTWIGEGATPQAARHDAAARALRELRREQNQTQAPVDTPDDNKETNGETKSPVSLVHELALKRNLSVDFSVKSERGPPHMRVFVTTCTVGDLETEGEGNGKKVSKKRAAESMLEEMKRRWPGAVTRQVRRRPAPTKRKPRNLIKENTESNNSGDASDNPVAALAAARAATRSREPIYKLLDERGAARRREFLVQCDAPPHTACATGPNKKAAKRRAARDILVQMGLLPPEGSEKGPEIIRPVTPRPESNSDDIDKNVSPEKPQENSNSTGRQLVPGVLIMQDANKSNVNVITNGSLAEVPSSINSKTTLGAKDQLTYLSKLLGFTVQFSDFPKRNHGSYLTLVSLSTRPPVMAHGAGESTEASHEVCAQNALQALAAMGLDTTSTNEQAVEPNTNVVSNGQT